MFYLSRTNLPSLYFWAFSCADSYKHVSNAEIWLTNPKNTRKWECGVKRKSGWVRWRFTYFQPTFCPQQQQKISATVCIPESIILSSRGPILMFTLKIQNFNNISGHIRYLSLRYTLRHLMIALATEYYNLALGKCFFIYCLTLKKQNKSI